MEYMEPDTWPDRMMKAVRADTAFYTRVAADASLTWEGLMVALIPSIPIAYFEIRAPTQPGMLALILQRMDVTLRGQGLAVVWLFQIAIIVTFFFMQVCFTYVV